MRIYKLMMNDRSYEVEIRETSLHSIRAVVNGKEKVVQINEIKNIRDRIAVAHLEQPQEPSSQTTKSKHNKHKEEVTDNFCVQAPMPGLIKAITVTEGEQLVAGQEVCIIEAMKMENGIKTLGVGVVEKILVSVGDIVEQDQVLIKLR